MKEKLLAKIMAILVVSMLLMSTIPAFAGTPTEPHNANAIWVEPAISLTTANAAHTYGYKFKVYVWVNMSDVGQASGIDTWQVRMYFNPAYLNVTGVDYSEAGPPKTSELFAGKATTPVTPALGANYVQHGETCAPDYAAVPTGAKALFWVEFNVTAVPGKQQTLTDVFDISNDDTFLIDDQGGYYPPGTLNIDDGSYTFTWAPPPTNPRMAVEHDGFYGLPPASIPPADVWPVYWGPYPPKAVGSQFDAKVYIDNLAAAWGLTMATFCLCYNTTVIDTEVANITLNTAVWNPATATIAVVHGVPDEVQITVYPNIGVTPSGKVLVATIKFEILIQQDSPPYPMGYYDFSKLEFCDVFFEDHLGSIPSAAAKNGEVRILAVVSLPLAWLEVSPTSITLGPEPAIGQEFDVNVIIKNLHEKWYLVAYQFRLSFCPDLLELVSVTEGPFLTDSRWNLYGTFFTSYEESEGPMFPHHVVVGGILLPNDAGEYDQTMFPSAPGPNVTDLVPPVNPILVTIRFKCIYQPVSQTDVPLPEETCDLELLPFWLPENCHFVDRDGNYIPTYKIVNGLYTIIWSYATGRIIDLTGGAVNRGYGVPFSETVPGIFPAPYGGQGLGGNMDLVIPQSVVYLVTEVTYNCWPVQSKDVGFEIEGPFYQEGWTPEQPVPKDTPPFHIRKYAARTNGTGFAWVKFQMPWPCENPEDLFGKYRVTATVDICGEVVSDVMWFDYYYLVEITKVTTNKYYYKHCEDVVITIEFRSKAQQRYPVLFSVVIQDELETHFGAALIETYVSGAEFCHWKEYVVSTSIYVVKWAFAGRAKVYVSAYDKDPTIGGAPWLPTFGLGWPLDATVPEFWILPE